MKHPATRRPVPIDVAAALIFRGGRLLITQRRLSDHLGGFWEFPGGKREDGESFEHCLQREIREELGIEITVGCELEDITHDYGDKCVRLKFFKCALLAGEPRPIACPDLAWVTREQLRDFSFPAADARLIKLLEETPDLWQ